METQTQRRVGGNHRIDLILTDVQWQRIHHGAALRHGDRDTGQYVLELKGRHLSPLCGSKGGPEDRKDGPPRDGFARQTRRIEVCRVDDSVEPNRRWLSAGGPFHSQYQHYSDQLPAHTTDRALPASVK